MKQNFKGNNFSVLKVFKRLIPLFKLHPKTIIVLVLVGIVEALTESVGIGLFIPFIYSLENSEYVSDKDDVFGTALIELFDSVPQDERLLIVSACIFGLILLKGALTYFGILVSSRLSANLSHNLCCQAVDKLLYLDISQFEEKESGRFINIIEGETYSTAEAVEMVIYLVVTLCTFPIFALVLLAISWKMTLIVMSALVIISILIQFGIKGLATLSENAVSTDATFAQQILEIINGIYTIRVYGQEQATKADFARISYRTSHIGRSIDRLSGVIGPAFEILITLTLLGIFYTYLQNSGGLPEAIVFILIMFRLYPHVLDFNELRSEIVAAKASVDEVMDFLETSADSKIQLETTVYKGFQKGIEFKSVSFQYNQSDRPAMDEVSFSITKGKTLAVLGRSGSGKSTLIKQLIRFIAPTEGEILVDDVPIKNFELTSWRSRFAVVGQHDFMFNKSVRDNILIGLNDATDTEVIEAAKQAAAHEFISSLPQGYDTLLGDQGVRLSTGQEQRIALARAILRKPDIIILDEATNALDSISEQEILDALQKIKHDHTVIVIAHRLSTIADADHIIVLENGRIVEQGSSHQLLKEKKLFARLHELQIQGLNELSTDQD